MVAVHNHLDGKQLTSRGCVHLIPFTAQFLEASEVLFAASYVIFSSAHLSTACTERFY